MSQQQSAIGWYQPHISVDQDDLVKDPKTGKVSKMPSMTKQSFKDECDINNIVRKFELTGQLDAIHLNRAAGMYVDLPDGLDLQNSLDMIHRAETAFMSLPAGVRAEFDNDPVRFVEFFNDPSPANQEKVIAWGLAVDNRPPSSTPEPPPSTPPDPKK